MDKMHKESNQNQYEFSSYQIVLIRMLVYIYLLFLFKHMITNFPGKYGRWEDGGLGTIILFYAVYISHNLNFLINSSSFLNSLILLIPMLLDLKYLSLNFAVTTQRPQDISWRYYFGREVSDHKRTKIGRIKFLVYFVSTMSDIPLELRKILRIPLELIL